MMTIWFGGGLGNQMFQYGIYRSAQACGYDVKADLSGYDMMNMHNGVELETVFNIKLNVPVKALNLYQTDIVSRIVRKAGFKEFGVSRDIVREEKSVYIDNLISDVNKDKYLLGYWQSEKYFHDIADQMRRELVFPDLSEPGKRLAEEMRSAGSVSVHVRRGDYLKSSMYTDLSNTQYYVDAMKWIREQCGDFKCFLFSDDIPWCRRQFGEEEGIHFVEGNTRARAYEDMHLMSLCSHNIIANSSFSWWGAWLNGNAGKIVVAPDAWFTEVYHYKGDSIIPDRWHKLRVSDAGKKKRARFFPHPT